MPHTKVVVPECWAIFRPNNKGFMMVTSKKQEVDFYGSNGFPIVQMVPLPLVQMMLNRNMGAFSIVYPRAVVAAPGQTVIFDNSLIPLDEETEASLRGTGLFLGGKYVVDRVIRDESRGVLLDVFGVEGEIDACLFSILQ